MAESTTIFEFSVIHVKPKYVNHMLHALPNGKALFEKHGAKHHGAWLTAAGGWCEIYAIVEWPSVEKRIAMRSNMFKDPELVAHWNTVGKFMQSGENFICKWNSHIPMKPFNASRPIVVDRIKPKKFDVFATMKFMELATVFEKMGTAPIHAILHPVAYPDHCIWAIWEMTESQKPDQIVSNIAAAHHDPKNWAHMEESREAFEIQSVVIATPIPFDQLPPLDKLS